jgi:muramidase (phage lysozyme)
MTHLSDAEAGGKNVTAFLDMLAYSEGTDNGKQPTECDGYDVIVGGGLAYSTLAHPNKLISLPRYGIKSTAAGRYQFLKRTWDALQKQLKLPDFSPESQDKACIQLLKECKALPLIKAGKFDEAVFAARKIWASLPGAGYGQHEQGLAKLRQIYLDKGGKLTKET